MSSRRGQLPIAVAMAMAVGFAAAAFCVGAARAGVVPVPNASFESPVTSFVDLNIDAWQKTPKPDWYSEDGGFLWTQLMGTFRNTPPGNFDHIDNCDGDQGAWVFAIPEAGIFQDYDSVSGTDPAPTHAFDATFEVGKAYTLTVGAIGLGGGMSNGATAELSLYYRDAAGQRLTAAAASITNAPDVFSNRTQFVDFTAKLPTVTSADPWAGRHMGVQILSTVTTNLQGGYWDFDHVRLVAQVPPALRAGAIVDGHFTLLLQSEPGLSFAILGASDPGGANWIEVGTVTNATGTVSFTDGTAIAGQRFYRARQLP